MTALRLKIFAAGALTVLGLFISPAVFVIFGGMTAIVFLQAGFEVIFSALILEIFAGLPTGVISLPLGLANVTVEFLRDQLNNRSSASLAAIFLAGIFAFSISHITAMHIVL